MVFSNISNTNLEVNILKIYKDLINCWNTRDGINFAKHFIENGNIIGFDGGQLNSKKEIESNMIQIFNHLQTASYLCIVRDIRLVQAQTGILKAVVGMIPDGTNKINQALNSIQSVTVVLDNNTWKIAQLHITPAQYHAYPNLTQELTEELIKLQ